MKWWFVMDLKHNMLGRVWNKWGNVATFPNEFGCRCCRYTTLYCCLADSFDCWFSFNFHAPVYCAFCTHTLARQHTTNTHRNVSDREPEHEQDRDEVSEQHSTAHIYQQHTAHRAQTKYIDIVYLYMRADERSTTTKKHTHNTSYFMYIHTYFYFERIIHFIHSFVTWFSFPFTSSSSSLVSVCVCVHIFLHIFSVSFALLVSFYASPFDAGELIYH